MHRLKNFALGMSISDTPLHYTLSSLPMPAHRHRAGYYARRSTVIEKKSMGDEISS